MHLVAVEPNAELLPHARDVGFDSVTHYVHLPDWKGPFEQDYVTYAARRAGEWADWARTGGLPTHPRSPPAGMPLPAARTSVTRAPTGTHGPPS